MASARGAPARRPTFLYLGVLLSFLLFAIVSSEPIPYLSAYAMDQKPLHEQASQPSEKIETASPEASLQEELSKLDVGYGKERVWESAEMASVAEKFTPEVMLAAPRRSTAQPNDAGTYALYTVSTYSFESAKKTKEIRLFDIQAKTSTLITNDDKAGEPHWLEDSILYLRDGKDDSTELVVTSVDGTVQPYTVASVPGALSDLKLRVLESGKIALVGSAKSTHEGKMLNPETEIKRNHTGVVYDSTFVRHWDHYVDTTTNALWYGLVSVDGKGIKARYTLSTLTNALKDTNLESPISPFPGPDHYDIGSEGIVFVAKDPELNPAFHTKCNFYVVDIPDFTKAPKAKPRVIQAKGLEGAATGPVISPNGKMAVYMQMKEDGYEADRNRVLLVQNLASDEPPLELFKDTSGRDMWDRSPSKAIWGVHERTIFFLAENYGRGVAWSADLSTIAYPLAPQQLTNAGTISDIVPVSEKIAFVSGSSLVDNSFWGLLEVGRFGPVILSSNTNNGRALGLSTSQTSTIVWSGAQSSIQAWVVRPNGYDKSSGKKLPLAMAIHGGPQGAWLDSWSTRWNPAVLAEQGYMVVAPNPTGSTSYGQSLTDAIQDNWGGDPYEDLVKGFQYIRDNMADEVDIDHAVALGASYGGYMINWIQGHDLGRKFKALVCHDGVFSTAADLAQDEMYFPIHDHGGLPWDVPKKWQRWSPANHIDQWATPQLIIHSEKDYRLAMPEGLAAFNVLQGRGVESRLLYFPDENHWVLKEENSRVWHTVVFNWLNKHAGLPEYADEDKIVGPPVGRKYRK